MLRTEKSLQKNLAGFAQFFLIVKELRPKMADQNPIAFLHQFAMQRQMKPPQFTTVWIVYFLLDIEMTEMKCEEERNCKANNLAAPHISTKYICWFCQMNFETDVSIR